MFRELGGSGLSVMWQACWELWRSVAAVRGRVATERCTVAAVSRVASGGADRRRGVVLTGGCVNAMTRGQFD